MRKFYVSALFSLFLALFLVLSNASYSYASSSVEINYKHYEVPPWELLKDNQFRELYLKATERFKNIDWIRNIRATAPPNRVVRINGENYVYIEFCKPHSCSNEMVFLLFNPQKNKIFGTYLMNTNGKYVEVVIGNPNSEEFRILHKLMKKLSGVSF